jgi:hypothetical protein
MDLKRLKQGLGIASLLLASSQAGAWGPMQHKMVALVAQDRLSPRTLQAVQDILGGDIGLDKIASCADEMLYATDPVNCGGAFLVPADPYKTTRTGHFLNIPITESPSAASVMNYCPNGKDCVVEQVRRQAQTLGNRNSSLQQRRMALMYLVHFVADEHQPLHGAGDDDWGGSAKPVVFHGKKKNLHSLWDGMVRINDREEDPAPLVGELKVLINDDAGLWTAGDFITEAMLESFVIAKDRIYAQYARDRGENLGQAYEDEMQPIAKRRLAMAGVRLAAILEQALGRDSAPQTLVGFQEGATSRLNSRLQARDSAVKFD